MKYLKLYEGFDSNALSSVLSYITKNINRKSSNDFLTQLKNITHYNDIPLSILNDDTVKYMSAKKAILINEEDEVANPTEIFCIKFWFSLKKGLIGTTGVGNLKMDFNELSNGKLDKFDDRQLSELNRNDELNNLGVLKPVKKLEDLKTGDKVLCCLTSNYNRNRIYVGEIYKDDRTNDTFYYMFQDYIEGSSPSTLLNGIQISNRYNLYGRDNNERVYRYSYALGDNYQEYEDHCFLSTFSGEGELRYEDDEVEDKDSIWDYNLRYNYRTHDIVKWINRNDVDNLKKADFAIILYLDDILSDLNERENFKSNIIEDRSEQKKDALALNKNIKNENINRYLNKLFNNLNITKDNKIFGNLSNSISAIIGGKYCIIIFYDNNTVDNIYDFSYEINRLMNSLNLSEYEVDKINKRLNSIYNTGRTNADYYKKNVISNINVIKSYNNDKVNIITDKLLTIGEYINNFILKNEIKTLNDLRLIYHKLLNIRSIFLDDVFSISIKTLFKYMSYEGDYDTRYCMDDFDYKDERFKKDLEKLNDIEKYIKSV